MVVARIKDLPRNKDVPRSRAATREFRKAQLIEATIDSIAKRGFAETTLADVADGAGLSRGIVNFHFQSKEQLLVETLQMICATSIARSGSAALAKAGAGTVERPDRDGRADFDPADLQPQEDRGLVRLLGRGEVAADLPQALRRPRPRVRRRYPRGLPPMIETAATRGSTPSWWRRASRR